MLSSTQKKLQFPTKDGNWLGRIVSKLIPFLLISTILTTPPLAPSLCIASVIAISIPVFILSVYDTVKTVICLCTRLLLLLM